MDPRWWIVPNSSPTRDNLRHLTPHQLAQLAIHLPLTPSKNDKWYLHNNPNEPKPEIRGTGHSKDTPVPSKDFIINGYKMNAEPRVPPQAPLDEPGFVGPEVEKETTTAPTDTANLSDLQLRPEKLDDLSTRLKVVEADEERNVIKPELANASARAKNAMIRNLNEHLHPILAYGQDPRWAMSYMAVFYDTKPSAKELRGWWTLPEVRVSHADSNTKSAASMDDNALPDFLIPENDVEAYMTTLVRAWGLD
ncbi:hypothetical protein MMC07_008509 [Pseudocyphellaria aurata]|nr:hypothetical protein [Pseudocyphellaria aurata]